MKNYLILSLLFCSTLCFSQTQTIKVLGQHAYENKVKSFGALISLVEDPNKCDPVKGFISIEDQLKHLGESITAKGSKATLKPVDEYQKSQVKSKSYRIEESNRDLFDQILLVCAQHEAKIIKSYYNYYPHDFVGEDEKAIAALNDAKTKAKELAEHLNCKLVRILNVDDDTRNANSYFLQHWSGDKARLADLMSVVNGLDNRYSIDIRSSSPNRSGKYNLWVTFEIEAK